MPAFRQQIRLQTLVLPGNRASRFGASELGENRAEFLWLSFQILRQELLECRSSLQFLDVGKQGRRAFEILNRGITKQGNVAIVGISLFLME